MLVVQRLVPHYRVPFFRALAASDDVAYEFAFGAARRGSALEGVMAPEGLTTHALGNAYFAPGGIEIAVWQRGLARLVRGGGYDAVIAEFNPRIASSLVALAAARRAGVRWVWWGHGAGPEAGALTMRVRVALARAADAVVFYDEARAAAFVAAGLDADRAFVAPNSLDLSPVTAVARPPVRAADRVGRDCVLSVSRLRPEKRVDLLVRAFAHARDRFRRPQRLVVVGDGPERGALERLAASLGVGDAVEFAGAVFQPDALAARYNAAWVAATPGALGLAAVHALAFGVPQVVARGEPHGPEVSALADGENAVFVPGGDVAALADALVALEGNPERWAGLARAARATADTRLGLDRMVAAFDAAVRRACGGRDA